MADAPDLNAALLRAQQAAAPQGPGTLGGGPLGGMLRGSAIGACRLENAALINFNAKIGGPFGIRPKQGGMAAQLDYEAQKLSEMNNAAHSVLAQACAAAAPAAEAIRQASTMEIMGNTSFADLSGARRGGDGFGVA